MGGLDGFPGSWLQPGPPLASTAIQGMDQQMENRSAFPAFSDTVSFK